MKELEEKIRYLITNFLIGCFSDIVIHDIRSSTAIMEKYSISLGKQSE